MEPKRWQTEIWIGERMDQPVVIYGESLAQLQTATLAWLMEYKPLAFGNASPDSVVLDQIKRYFYSDGSRKIGIFSPNSSESTAILEMGWYYIQDSVLFPQPRPLESFNEVVAHFAENALIPAQGPEFKAPPSTDTSTWAVRLSHPAVLGAIFGIIAALCYLAMPISGGYRLNFVLAQGSIEALVMFAFFMVMVFGVIGAIVSIGFSKFQAK